MKDVAVKRRFVPVLKAVRKANYGNNKIYN